MPSKVHESELVEVHSNPIQHKEPIPDVIPSNSSFSEDDAYRYRVMLRKRSIRPQNRFRLKSKAMYDPAIKDKFIVIDEEPTSPEVESLESKNVSTTRSEQKKPKKNDLATNKKVPTEKEMFLQNNKGNRVRKALNL
jgi:hypothetical protein